ncbi:DUF2971 domain-containing protein [Mucilaginibacter xinganensis]|uniref:DUF2971 domain-containing protein n=1 Tax=Mucilaginibacter xinganensis TaxID=1234841 RepID=A0A223NXH4_9SPHI|nr:DUF2971 domain-containing protein [Mucilaginibacter xinganensis]ASU34261.1 hypothetical protein MuYL_2372 [Mucilaginibacter xinganensis]
MINDDDIQKLSRAGLQKLLNKGLFYKYINFNDGFEHILKSNTLKFSDPEAFNDPFDCNEKLINISISEEYKEELYKELEKKYHMTDKMRELFGAKANDPNIYRDALLRKKKEFKVSCFSEKCNEVLMWSHYADKHTGICIGFELEFKCADYVFYPVNYISEIAPVDGMTFTTNVFYYWLTTKSFRWEYEQEIRAINKNGKEIVPFEKKAIKEILFGCKVAIPVIENVIFEMGKMGYQNVVFSKMEIDPDTFLLKKVIIN